MVVKPKEEKSSQDDLENDEDIVDEGTIEEESPEYYNEMPADEIASFLGENSYDEEIESPFSTADLLEFEDASKRVPTRAKALMEELFRAKLSRVQRLNKKDLF